MKIVANRDMVSHLLTFVKPEYIIHLSLIIEMFRNIKGGFRIANEIVFTELRFRKVMIESLAEMLGMTKQELLKTLRFELDEQEKIRMIFLIDEIANYHFHENQKQ